MELLFLLGEMICFTLLWQAVAQMNGMGSSAGGVPPGTPQQAAGGSTDETAALWVVGDQLLDWFH